MIAGRLKIRSTMAPAGWLALLLLLFAAGFPVADGRPSANDPIVQELNLENLTPREKERIRAAAIKLLRIRNTIGDPGRGECSNYLKVVDELARFLKRGTVEEMRRLSHEAETTFKLVDREWINRTFIAVRDRDLPVTATGLGKLEDQKFALRQVGNLVKQAQAIPAKQKKLESVIDRGYRNLIRLQEEAHHTFESIDYPPAQAVLEPVVHEIDQVLLTQVRPAHDRQDRLLGVHRRVLRKLGNGKGERIVRLFREYTSKVAVIQRSVDRRPTDSN